MSQRFTPTSRAAILRAQNLALSHKNYYVSPAHLFLALLESATPESFLGALILSAGLKREATLFYVESTITLTPEPNAAPTSEARLTADAKRILELAAKEAIRNGDSFIDPEHLLLACLHKQKDNDLATLLSDLGWDLTLLRAQYRELRGRHPRHYKNPLELLTGSSQAVINAAYASMRSAWCGRISTAHLLMGLLEDKQARELLEAIGTSFSNLKDHTRASIRSDSQLATPEKRFDKGAKRALDRAKTEALARGNLFIAPEHILLALLPQRATLREKLKWGAQVPDVAAPVLTGTGLDAQKLRELVGPRLKNASCLPRTPSPDVPRTAIPLAFGWMAVAGTISSYFLFRRHSPTRLAVVPVEVIILFLALLLVTSLGACWVLLTSRKPNLKSAWTAAFAGLLAGMVVGMVLANLLFL